MPITFKTAGFEPLKSFMYKSTRTQNIWVHSCLLCQNFNDDMNLLLSLSI